MNKNRSQIFSGLVCLLSLVILGLMGGCGEADLKESNNYLRLRLAQDPTTLDPAAIVDVAGGALAAKVFNGLVRFDPEGQVIGDLASSWELLPNARTYRFQLKPGARFSNGSEVEAEDVIYSFQRLLDPEVNSPRSWLLEKVKGAPEFIQGKTDSVPGLRSPAPGLVEIELSEPFSLFVSLLAMPNAAVLPRGEVKRLGREFSRAPVGSGPFKLKRWDHGNRLILVRNDNYLGPKPKLEGVIYRVIPEDLTAALEFEQGNLDIIEVPRAQFKKFTTGKFKDRVVSRSGLNTYYVGINCSRPVFSNPMIRQALNWAVDREKICRQLLDGRADPARGPVPPELLSDPDLAAYGYNPDKARRMLKAAGVELPLKLELLVSADRANVSVAEVLQDYWKKVGVEVEIVQREWSAFKEEINRGDFDLFYLSWWGDYPSPENFLYPTFFSANLGSAGNRSRFSDPGLDLILRAARRRPDREGEENLYRKAQRRVVESAPWVFLWHTKQYLLLDPRVKNYNIPLLYSSDNLERVSVN